MAPTGYPTMTDIPTETPTSSLPPTMVRFDIYIRLPSTARV
jgi:hypothetical protein